MAWEGLGLIGPIIGLIGFRGTLVEACIAQPLRAGSVGFIRTAAAAAAAIRARRLLGF